MKDNIVLCGFMGCGKTTVGNRLAKLTGRKFIDMDAYIVENEKMSISDIFSQHGEDYFRELEHQACKKIGNEFCRIIATGGGAVIFERNVEALKTNGIIVYLEISPETVIERLKNNTTRPLLMCEDRDEYIKNLMAQRDPYYRNAANFVVNAEQAPDYVALNIMQTVKIL